MRQLSIAPSITVTIGHHTRLYFAFVTTAPADLDSPATMTLHGSTFAEISGFAAEPITMDGVRARMSAQLVLVDAMELAGSEPGTAGTNTRSCLRILCSSASTHCSTGCGNASRRPWPARSRHEPLNPLTGVNRSPFRRAFQEVTL
jgi:hypothetical protein